jgi:uncharacterized membrane protein YhaH (DUF805 family)
MSLFASGVTELARFADYRGRSTRTDLGAFWLVTTLAGILLLVPVIILEIVAFSDTSLSTFVSVVYQWIVTIPMLALIVRRLHDQGRSGWWAAIGVPVAAQNIIADYYLLTADVEAMLAARHATSYLIAVPALLVIFMFMLAPGQEGPNRFGPNPRFDRPGEPA